MRVTHISWAVLAVIAARLAPALAVVEVKLPLAKVYADSRAVVVGTVSKVQADTGAVDVTVAETLAGDPVGERVRVNVPQADLKGLVAEGQTVLLLPNRRAPAVALLHLGDVWVLANAQPGAKLPVYTVAQRRPDLDHTFPGRTAALLELLRRHKAGKPIDLLDKADPRVLTGGVKELGRLPVAGATAVAAGDFDGDKKLDLAVATAAGVRVFTHDGKSFVPTAAAAPAGFPPKPPATNKGADADKPLAAVAGAFGEAGEPAAIVVRAKGIFRERAGDAGKDPAGGRPSDDDFRRLTGDPLATYLPGFDKGVDAAAATAIDVNGDGKPDVAILTRDGGLLLVNRGHGAFFVVPNLTKLIAGDDKPPPFAAGPGTLLAAADVDGDKREELVAVAADGRVWVVGNPAP